MSEHTMETKAVTTDTVELNPIYSLNGAEFEAYVVNSVNDHIDKMVECIRENSPEYLRMMDVEAAVRQAVRDNVL